LSRFVGKDIALMVAIVQFGFVLSGFEGLFLLLETKIRESKTRQSKAL
jgi:hypothetical protein